MSRITRTETKTQCDFCRVEDSSTVPLGWFRVTSVFAEYRMAIVRDASPSEAKIWHACAQCGGKLYLWLGLVGIDYTFTAPKGDFSEGGRQFGSILVGVKGKNDAYVYREGDIVTHLAPP